MEKCKTPQAPLNITGRNPMFLPEKFANGFKKEMIYSSHSVF